MIVFAASSGVHCDLEPGEPFVTGDCVPSLGAGTSCTAEDQ